MLTLTRKAGETIHIGQAVVTIRKTGPVRASISIDAPPSVAVRRGELDDQEEGQDQDDHQEVER